MDLAELDYDLPSELIAQHPAERRDASRLLVYERETGAIRHRVFSDLPEELHGELVVVNDTPRRAGADPTGQAPRGGVAPRTRVRHGLGGARPADAPPEGGADVRRRSSCSSISARGGGACGCRASPTARRRCRPTSPRRSATPSATRRCTRTSPGSAAAPTAGLHFTPELLEQLDVERVTLHVGLDTFRPVSEPTLEEHRIHGERYEVAPTAWERIEAAERVLAVGTTTVRTLETVARTHELHGRTELFITPGFEFRRVDALLTNFHLPRSTLLALVMAFAGVEETRRLYATAVDERYRFYSFGDAMLIL